MALVLPSKNTSSLRTWGTVNLSTNTDGLTGSDILDCGGLVLSAIALSTSVSAACTYGFYGSADSTGVLQQLLTSTGGVLQYGTTATSMVGKTMVFDPAPFHGIRFIQLLSLTTSGVAPNATGASAKLGLSAYGNVK